MPIDYGSNNVTTSGNINVSGIVTAVSGNFTNLLVNGSSSVAGSGIINHIPYWNSSSNIVADSGQLTWDSTNNRLGIGTSAPSGQLHVIGSGFFSDKVGIGTTSSAEALTIYGDSKYLYLQAQNTSGRAGIKFGNTATRQQIYIEDTSHDLIIDSLDGGITESIRIGYNTGNVTINESGSNIDFRIEGDTDVNLLFTDASSDSVGIGTNSPLYKLHVVGTGNFSQNLLVNGIQVSVSGHTHTSSNISDLTDFIAKNTIHPFLLGGL